MAILSDVRFSQLILELKVDQWYLRLGLLGVGEVWSLWRGLCCVILSYKIWLLHVIWSFKISFLCVLRYIKILNCSNVFNYGSLCALYCVLNTNMILFDAQKTKQYTHEH